jgi:hypothetical protein
MDKQDAILQQYEQKVYKYLTNSWTRQTQTNTIDIRPRLKVLILSSTLFVLVLQN